MQIINFQSLFRQNKNIVFFLVTLIWAIFVLPSFFQPSWFYYDDPTTLLMGKALAVDFHIPKPDGLSGRYVPFNQIELNLILCFKIF